MIMIHMYIYCISHNLLSFSGIYLEIILVQANSLSLESCWIAYIVCFKGQQRYSSLAIRKFTSIAHFAVFSRITTLHVFLPIAGA